MNLWSVESLYMQNQLNVFLDRRFSTLPLPLHGRKSQRWRRGHISHPLSPFLHAWVACVSDLPFKVREELVFLTSPASNSSFCCCCFWEEKFSVSGQKIGSVRKPETNLTFHIARSRNNFPNRHFFNTSGSFAQPQGAEILDKFFNCQLHSRQSFMWNKVRFSFLCLSIFHCPDLLTVVLFPFAH